MIELWQNHWHCILPAAVILIALMVIQCKDKMNNSQKSAKEYNELSGGKDYGEEHK